MSTITQTRAARQSDQQADRRSNRQPDPRPDRQPVVGADERVRDYLAAAIVCTLVCFAPTGVAAVVFAGQARTLAAAGDLGGARRAAAIAKRLCLASVAVTVSFLVIVVVGADGYSSTH
jgi:hypothetical protein